MISSLDDKRKKRIKYSFILTALLIFSIMLFLLSFRFSRYPYTLQEVYDSLFNYDNSNAVHDQIIYKLIRLTSIIIVSASLALAGLIMQTITRNDLASPSILGVSAAVSLGATIFSVYFITQSLILLFAWSSFFAFIPMIIILGVMRASGGRVKGIYLAFLGIALGVIMNSMNWFLKYNNDQSAAWLLTFLNSGFTNPNLSRLVFFAPTMLVIILINVMISKKYQLLEPGEEFSKGVGNNVTFVRTIAVLSAGILVPASMLLGGNILYVGLIVPHIVKLFLKTKNFFVLSIGVIFTSIILLLTIQIISSYISLNFGAFIDLIAAPLLIVLARRSK